MSGIYTALQEAQRALDERTAAAKQAAQALADKQAEYDASLARLAKARWARCSFWTAAAALPF